MIVDEVVSVGVPQKLFGRGPVSGPRFTDRRSFGTRSLDVKKTTILDDATRVELIHKTPNLPADLPVFYVTTVVKVTLKNGDQKEYKKSVKFDLR